MTQVFLFVLTNTIYDLTRYTGENELGTVVSAVGRGKNFHALVCHSLKPKGWDNTPESIVSCLDKIDVKDYEPIAIVLMGAGMIGQFSGANIAENVKAIHRSKKNCILYTLDFTAEAILKTLKLKKFPTVKQLS